MKRLMLAAAALVLAMAAAPASADSEPWKDGVTPERMAKAQQILEAGNALFLEKDYSAALAKYQEAVAVWDHPAIRFNIVRSLIQLDRVVEAYENLELALKYGAAPLEDTVYNEALSYKKLLEKQIAHVVVACGQSGVHVTFDGQPLMACPGKQIRRVLPGQHQVVGKRTGYLTRTVEVVVIGGKNEQVALALDPLGAVGTISHRWPTWIPWLVVGSGVGVVGVGALVQTMAVNDHDRYYEQAARECAPTGCDPGFGADLKDQAIFENRLAIGMFSAGAAAVITGGVMLYLNRGRVVYPQDTHALAAGVAPSRGGATFVIRGGF